MNQPIQNPVYRGDVQGKTTEEILQSAEVVGNSPKGEYLRIAAQVRATQELMKSLDRASRQSSITNWILAALTLVLAAAAIAELFRN